MPKSIFISHVYEDNKNRDDVVRWVKEGLLGADIVTVTEAMDVRQQGGTAIEQHLKPRIRGAAAVVALIGQNTHNHEWVNYELAVATSLNVRVILARIPGTTGALPKDFQHLPVVALDPTALVKALAG